MDDRCFRLLGLREDASKAQVAEAYDKRCKKYKSNDYADDPDYVKRKLFDLKVAYDDAMAIASGEMPKTTHVPKNTFGHEKNKSLKTLKETFESLNVGETEKSKKVIDEEAPDIREDVMLESIEDYSINGVKKSYSKSTGQDKSTMNMIGTVIGIIVAVIGLFSFIFNNDTTYYDEDYVETDLGYYNVSDTNDITYIDAADETISQLALRISDANGNLEMSNSWSSYEVTNSELLEAANKFASKYFDGQTISTQAEKLLENYKDEFWYDSGDTSGAALKAILEFYHFPSPLGMEGCVNPYNGKTIGNIVDYLQYIDDFYDANYKK